MVLTISPLVVILEDKIQKQPREVYYKKGVLKSFAKFLRNTFVELSFLIKFIKKETPTQVLSCEYCEILKTHPLQNTFGPVLLTIKESKGKSGLVS